MTGHQAHFCDYFINENISKIPVSPALVCTVPQCLFFVRRVQPNRSISVGHRVSLIILLAKKYEIIWGFDCFSKKKMSANIKSKGILSMTLNTTVKNSKNFYP